MTTENPPAHWQILGSVNRLGSYRCKEFYLEFFESLGKLLPELYFTGFFFLALGIYTDRKTGYIYHCFIEI